MHPAAAELDDTDRDENVVRTDPHAFLEP